MKLFEELHKEYHKAEEKICKRFKIKEIHPTDRAKGIVAYLSCVAIENFKKNEKNNS